MSLGRRDGLLQYLNPDGSPRDKVLTRRPAALYKEVVLRSVAYGMRHPANSRAFGGCDDALAAAGAPGSALRLAGTFLPADEKSGGRAGLGTTHDTASLRTAGRSFGIRAFSSVANPKQVRLLHETEHVIFLWSIVTDRLRRRFSC